MAFADDFDDMLIHTVLVEPWTGTGPQGAATYGTGVALRCRVVFGDKLYRFSGGQDVLSHARLFAGASPIVGPKDRITLPDGSQPPILGSPTLYPDENGDAVQTVVFGRAGGVGG